MTQLELLRLAGRIPLPMLLFFLLVVLICGCEEDAPPICPSQSYSVVEGRVTAGGQPAHALIRLGTPSERGWGDPAAGIQSWTDSTGWYEIEAPIGRYILRVHSYGEIASFGYGGALPEWETPDTLLLTEERARVDFNLASLSIEVTTPPVFEGRYLYLGLHRLDELDRRTLGDIEPVIDGRLTFNFPVVFPSEYCLALGPQNGETYWAPGTWNPDNAAIITVGTDEPVAYSISVAEPWHIEGQITGSWQIMRLDPPRLVAFVDESTVVAESKTASNGTYSLAIPLPEPVRLLVVNGGMQRWVGGSDFATATTYVGDPGENVVGVSYTESGIECRLESEERPTRLRAEIALYDTAGTRVTPEGFDPARDNPIPIPDLKPGTYFLQSWRHWSIDPWLPQWFDHADSLGDATPIEVLGEGSVTRITMHLETELPEIGLVSSKPGDPRGPGVGIGLMRRPIAWIAREYSCNK